MQIARWPADDTTWRMMTGSMQTCGACRLVGFLKRPQCTCFVETLCVAATLCVRKVFNVVILCNIRTWCVRSLFTVVIFYVTVIGCVRRVLVVMVLCIMLTRCTGNLFILLYNAAWWHGVSEICSLFLTFCIIITRYEGERPQTHVLDRATTELSNSTHTHTAHTTHTPSTTSIPFTVRFSSALPIHVRFGNKSILETSIIWWT